MAVFYVMPPRKMLGEQVAQMLRPYIPGLAIEGSVCAEFVDSLVANSSDGSDSYLVHREDLPVGEEMKNALRETFGAESGDRVVEVSFGLKHHEPVLRDWQLEAA